MKPIPCKLVLAMSIAGLGASLGGAVYARSDADATSPSVSLPLRTVGMPADSFKVRIDRLPPTAALPLDIISGVTGTGAATTKRRLACISATAAPVAAPRSLWGARRAALRAPTYGRPEAHAIASDRSMQAIAGGAEAVACSNAPLRDDPARYTVVDGFRVRPPKAPPAKRTWEALGAGDDPDANHLSRRRAGDGSAFDAATPAQRVLEALALYRPAADTLAAQVDIDPGVSDGVYSARREQHARPAGDVDLPIEIDPVNEPGTIAATDSAPTTVGVGVGVDIALDLELDFYLRSIAAPGSDSPHTMASPGASSEQRTAADANPHAGTTDAHRDQAAAVLDLELDLQPPTVGSIVDEAPAPSGGRRALGADAQRPSVAAASGGAAGGLDLDLDQPAGAAVGAPTAFLDLNLDLPHVALDLELDLPAAVPGFDRRPAKMSLEIAIQLDLGLAGGAAQAAYETVVQTPATAGFLAAAIAPASAATAAPVDVAVASTGDATAPPQAHHDVGGPTDAGTASRSDAALQDAALVPPPALTRAVPSDTTAATARDVADVPSAETLLGTAAASSTAATGQAPVALPRSGGAAAMPGGILVGLPEPTTHPQPTALGDIGDTVALGETRLDEVRGGFQTSDGLQVSLGIERAVYINGNLVTTPNLNVVDLAPGAGVRPVNISEVGASGVTLVQHGTGNTFVPGALSTAAGTVIQNTLDGQTIRSITSINATVNSLEIMRARNFESSMRGAIVDSLRR